MQIANVSHTLKGQHRCLPGIIHPGVLAQSLQDCATISARYD